MGGRNWLVDGVLALGEGRRGERIEATLEGFNPAMKLKESAVDLPDLRGELICAELGEAGMLFEPLQASLGVGVPNVGGRDGGLGIGGGHH
jgi:hypothetical protein